MTKGSSLEKWRLFDSGGQRTVVRHDAHSRPTGAETIQWSDSRLVDLVRSTFVYDEAGRLVQQHRREILHDIDTTWEVKIEGGVPPGWVDAFAPPPDMGMIPLAIEAPWKFFDSPLLQSFPEVTGKGEALSLFLHHASWVHFDQGLPVEWGYSPPGRQTICQYGWKKRQIAEVRCANQPEDASFEAQAVLRMHGNASVIDVLEVEDVLLKTTDHYAVVRDTRGGIRSVLRARPPRHGTEIARDELGREVRRTTWREGEINQTRSTSFACPSPLPALPPGLELP